MAKEDESQEAFTARLRAAMDALELDQRGLADALEVDEASVSRWFNKGHMPKARTLAKMPRVLGVSVDWLVGAPNAAKPNTETIRRAIDEAVTRARLSLRDEILRAFDEWAERQERRRR